MLNLNESELRTIVAEAIIAKLDDETRKDIIQQAVTKIITPEKQGYGGYGSREESPLQMAFAQAVRNLAYEATRDYIATHPDIKSQIDSLIQDGITKMIADQGRVRQAIGEAVASSLAEEFRRD